MYSSAAIVALALVAVAAPTAFAAPTPISQADQSGALSWKDVGNGILDFVQGAAPLVQSAADIANAFSGKGKREFEELFSRELAELQARQESGALSWQDVSDFGNKVLDTLQSITPAVTSAADAYHSYKGGKREEHDMLRRELHSVARDILMGRAVPTTDASGALSWQDVKDFGSGFVQGFTKTAGAVLPLVTPFLKREDIDIFARDFAHAVVARQVQDAESGAISWDDVKDFGKGFVQGFTKTAGAVLPLVTPFLKREEIELLARQLAQVQVQDPTSGAISWQDVKDFGKGFVQGFTKTAGAVLPLVTPFLKREEIEMFNRDLDGWNELLARQQSGALSFQDVKDFGKGFVQGFTKTAGAVLPLVTPFLKRHEVELLSRELEGLELLARGDMGLYARSLNELD